MRTGWVMALMFMFVILQLVMGVCELSYSGTEASIFYSLMQPNILNTTNPLTTIVSGVSIGWDYLGIFWRILWFDYPFLTGSWTMVKYIVFMPISAGLIWGIVTMLFNRQQTA